MRGNSGFLRWLPSFATIISHLDRFTFFAVALLILATTTSTHAGPLTIRNKRMTRETYSDFDSSSQNDTQLDTGTCLLNGRQVLENSVSCEKKAGCRAIQKTGYCCPDYQCECEKDGKIFANGYKLVDPETPCKVCYCQGGEIVCSSVTCYKRDDCEPKYTYGVCCPDYDNCPPLENKTTPSKETSSTESSSSLSPLQNVPSNSKQQEISNGSINPLGIKIKEITKAGEIRIIDDKPKQTYQIIKPFDGSSSANQPKLLTPTISKDEQPPTNSVESNHEVDTPPVVNQSSELPSNAQTSTAEAVSNSTPETVNKLENADANAITDEDTLKIVRHTDSLSLNKNIEIEEDVSSANGTFLEQSSEEPVEGSSQKPIKNGDEVLIVDRNGQKQPITVFGIEGLQRGDETDDTSDYEEKKAIPKVSDSDMGTLDLILGSSTENSSTLDLNSNETEIIYENSSNDRPSSFDDKAVSDFDPIASSSDDFVRILISTKGTDSLSGWEPSTTEGLSSMLESGNKEIYDTVILTSGPDNADEDKNITGIIYDTFYHDIQTEGPYNFTTEGPGPSSESQPIYHHSVHHNTPEEDDTTPSEINPFYPTIADDVSIYDSEVLKSSLTHGEDDTETSHRGKSSSHLHKDDGKILSEVLEFKSNGSQQTTEGPDALFSIDWLKQENMTTEGLPSSQSTESFQLVSQPKIQERSPGEPFLVPEWERNMTTNMPNDILLTDGYDISKSESVEIDDGCGSGCGSGSTSVSVSINDHTTHTHREHTTPRVKKIIDIDNNYEASSDIGDNSSHSLENIKHDPKEDVESLKYNEEEDTIPGSDVAPRYVGNPALQKTLESLHDFHKTILTPFFGF